MSLKEIIGILENEKNKLQKENVELKKSNYEYAKEIRELKWEIKKLTVKLNALKKASNEVVDKPVVEGGSVPSIHTVTVGNGEGVEITGIKGTQEDLLKPDGEVVVEETPAKTKRSRRKKTEETPIFVEPIEEPENA